jgi:hypothetical protein
MLKITIPAQEFWDSQNSMFVNTKEQTLELEHSLVSLSKWESKWCKPFLVNGEKTEEETLDYIKCMTLTRNVDPVIYRFLTADNHKEIRAYIDAPMTATTFPAERTSGGGREIVTSELIYYWMFSLGIPLEWEKRHLNRLITLIRVFNIKNAPPKKQSTKDIMSRNAALNAARRKQLNSRG